MSNGIAKIFPKNLPVVQAPVPQAKPAKVLEIASIIGEGMHFEGSIELLTGLRIDGGLAGDVRKQALDAGEVAVHVSATGKVHGNIVADIVIIDGEVVGNVWAIKHLVVRGLIRGRASYGEAVELSGVIEAEISRMGQNELKDIDAMREHADAHSQAQDSAAAQGANAAKASKTASVPIARAPRAPRKPARTQKAMAETTT